MKTIVLLKPWGRFSEPGTVLEVLGPGDELGPNRVDALRAETLLRDGLAVEEVEPEFVFGREGEPIEVTTHVRKPKRGRRKVEG